MKPIAQTITSTFFPSLPHIVVIDAFQFHYFDHPVPVARAEDGHLYAVLDAVCQVFGLEEIREAQRILRHSVLRTMLAQATLGGLSGVLVLRVSSLATWLLNLPPEEVPHPRDRDELKTYQRSAAQALEEAFIAGRLSNWPLLADLLPYDAPQVHAYKEAVVALGHAREHLLSVGQSPAFFHQYATDYPC